ncbi:ATP-binding protein [Pseudomonas abietaniphila]|uniref:histidine kinase n=1 Tax=Pseudomonas abietaniphila TaxID=89065 RepID=A0A1G8KD83_9PSED|nr:ATP-binding protein [Pseudomonas abietaniphila]SDI41402.1 two-component system, OmpR family, sensor kinase [Pseudomonas abietaniphila]
MKSSTSLQKRLSLGLTLGITLLWLGATLATWWVVRHELDEVFDSALEETARRILPLAAQTAGHEHIDLPSLPEEGPGVRTENLAYLVRDGNGHVVMQSHDADREDFNPQPVEGFTNTTHHRRYSAVMPDGRFTIEVAQPLSHRDEAAREALLALLLPLLALVPISWLGTLLIVRVSLRSVLAYRRAIEARGAGDLSPVRAAKLPAEFDPLAEAVNHLLQRMRKALEAERSFTANSAHELRTPLAATLAQVQRLRHEAPQALQTRIGKIEGSLHDLARLSEKLMQLAKAEGGGLLSQAPKDLIPLLAHSVEEWNGSHGQRIMLTLPARHSLYSAIDPDAFGILLRNLIENGLKYGAQDQAIQVSLDDEAVLRVTNSGAVVPDVVLQHLTERFVRGNTDVSGSGLGLAIVNTIVQGVKGSLMLVSPAPGKVDGFEAMVRLPLVECSSP